MDRGYVWLSSSRSPGLATLQGRLPRRWRRTGRPDSQSALGMIRTCDTRFRKPMLYPLSYEGGAGAKRGRQLLAGRAGDPCGW